MKLFAVAFLLALAALTQAPVDAAWAATRDGDEPDHAESCRAHLRSLASGLKAYLIHHEAQLPESLRELYAEGYVTDLALLSCPASAIRIGSEAEIEAKTSYVLATSLKGERPVLLIREKAGDHGGKALAFYSDFQIREVAPLVTRRPEKPVVVPPKPEVIPPKPEVTPPKPEVTPPKPKVTPPAPSAAALHQQAVALHRQGRLPEAESLYFQAQTLDPGNPTYASDLGNVQLQLGKTEAAVNSYGLATRLAPNDAMVHRNLAGVLVSLGRWQESVPPAATAARLAPRNAAFQNDLGNIHYHLQQWHLASVAYYQALQVEPNNGLYHANYAGVLFLLGRRDDAVHVARVALGLGHRDHWIYAQLGLVR